MTLIGLNESGTKRETSEKVCRNDPNNRNIEDQL
jgi:hypothetical protein